jgi:hypothetical protein
MGAAAVVEKGRGGTAVEVGGWEPAPPHRARKACGPTRQANDSPVNFFMGLSLTIRPSYGPIHVGIPAAQTLKLTKNRESGERWKMSEQ